MALTRRRSPRLAVGIVMAGMLTGVSVTTSTAQAAPVFVDGFESGNLSAWSSVAGLLVQSSLVGTGSFAARATGSNTKANAYVTLGGTFPELFVRLRVHVVSRSTPVWFVSLRRSSGAQVASLGVTASGKLIVRDKVTSANRVSAVGLGNSAWHELELHLAVGVAGRADAWLDGAAVPDLGWTTDFGTMPIERVMVGEFNTGRTYDVAFDDVAVSTERQAADADPPSTPADLSASPLSPGQIDLSWGAAADDVGVAGYTVYRATTGDPFASVGTSAGTTFRDQGLLPATTYRYVVDAFDAAGNHSDPSPEASATTLDRPPNVVIFVTDDQPFDTIDRMPTVQAELVGKGMNFANAIATNPLCCPSRASILRGQYSHTTGVYDNDGPYGGFALARDLGLEGSMIGTWLDDAGYETGFVGKYMNGFDRHHVPPGWDFWRGAKGSYYDYVVSEDGVPVSYGSSPTDYKTDVLEGYADEFVRSADPAAPILLTVWPFAPHDPFTPAPEYLDDPRCDGAINTDALAFNEADVSDKPTYIRTKGALGASSIQSVGVERPEKQCRALLSVDDLIATVLGGLADTGRLTDTLIVFTADNGLSNGEHRWNSKEIPYEGSIRVPFLIRYDPLTGGGARAETRLVANVDIAPTLVDLLGLDVSPGCPDPPFGGICAGLFDGMSLVPLLDGTATSWRDAVLIEHYGAPTSNPVPTYCGLRTATNKFVRYTTGEEEMYDLASDPGELVNLLGDGSVTPSEQSLRNGFMDRLFGAGSLCVPTPPDYLSPP